jgi:hypothetical protein
MGDRKNLIISSNGEGRDEVVVRFFSPPVGIGVQNSCGGMVWGWVEWGGKSLNCLPFFS